MKILGLIPARGGSKGIPRKNIRIVNGKPLIAYTIEAARGSRYVSRVVVSSEDDEILKVARQYKAETPFVRPQELAQDTTAGIDPVLHALDSLSEVFDYVVLLQPTSPLRIAVDIDTCIEQCLSAKAPAAISVTPVQESPYWMYTLDAAGRMAPCMADSHRYPTRQSLPPAYCANGAVYVARVEWLRKTKDFFSPETVAYVMPRERSLDIDTPDDLVRFEHIISGSR